MSLLTTNNVDEVDEVHENLNNFRGIAAAKKLFWQHLGYDRVNEPYPARFLPTGLQQHTFEVLLFAQYEGFYIIYVRVAHEDLNAKIIRTFVSTASKHFPFAAFLFSDIGQCHWQFVYGRVNSNSATKRTLAHFDFNANELTFTRFANRLAALKTFDGNDKPLSLLALIQAYDKAFGFAMSRWQAQFSSFPTPVQLYLNSLAPFSVLDAANERALIRRIENCGPVIRGRRRRERLVPPDKLAEFYSCRNELIAANWRLSFYIARQYRTSHLDVTDLAQEGCLGLARAAELIDSSYGTRFSTYAYSWIKQHIQRAIDNHERTIRLPCHLEDRFRRRKHRHYILPDIKLVGTHPQKFERLTNVEIRHSHLEPLHANDRSELLKAAMRRLNDRQHRVLELRFGLNGEDEHTLEEVATIYNLTRERIRQIQETALSRLRSFPILKRNFPELLKKESSDAKP